MFVKNNYNPTTVAMRIKIMLKSNKKTQKELFTALGMAVNTLDNYKKSMPKSDNLAFIADYLDCSVDYLLGRTDNPQIAGEIHISSDNGSISNIGNNANITVSGNNDVDKTTKEFTAIFSSLDLEDRFEVMKLLMEKRKK